MRLIATILVLIPVLALAQGRREGDAGFAPQDLAARLSGQVATFYDGSTASYGADGSYAYLYQPGDAPFRGTYETREDSRVCVVFDNGFDRCDTIVQAGERLVLITADGYRFPIRTLDPMP